MTRKESKKNKLSVRNAISSILLILAIAVLFYPIVANYIVSQKSFDLIEKFNGETDSLPKDELAVLIKDAERYNEYLFSMSKKEAYNKSVPDYNKILNIDEFGLMGYVTIPQIRILNIPMYHGYSDEVLEMGVGHIPQTSLPVGGINTHCVLSAHSGRANNSLFSDLDKLKNGDVFFINTLNLRMKYRIKNIQVVKRKEVSSLNIRQDKDLVTLVTCYPTGVNSHRLLVTGERIPNENVLSQEKIIRNKYGYDFWVLLGSVICILVALVYLIYKGLKKKNIIGKEVSVQK